MRGSKKYLHSSISISIFANCSSTILVIMYFRQVIKQLLGKITCISIWSCDVVSLGWPLSPLVNRTWVRLTEDRCPIDSWKNKCIRSRLELLIKQISIISSIKLKEFTDTEYYLLTWSNLFVGCFWVISVVGAIDEIMPGKFWFLVLFVTTRMISIRTSWVSALLASLVLNYNTDEQKVQDYIRRKMCYYTICWRLSMSFSLSSSSRITTILEPRLFGRSYISTIDSVQLPSRKQNI